MKKEAVLGVCFISGWIIVSVFVTLGCFHKSGGFEQHSHLRVLETGKSKIKVPPDLASGEGSLPDL